MQTISKGVCYNVPGMGYCMLFQTRLKVEFFNNVFWYNMVLLLKRIGTTELDNCLDLYWQLWLSKIIGLKSISADLTSFTVFVIDAHSSRWPNHDDTIPISHYGRLSFHTCSHNWRTYLNSGSNEMAAWPILKFSYISYITRSIVYGQGDGY